MLCLMFILGCRGAVIYRHVSLVLQRRSSGGIITLTVHLVGSTVRGSWIARILKVVAAVLLQLLDAAGRGLVLTRDLGAGLVADGRQLDGAARLLVARGGGGIRGAALGIGGRGGGAGAVVVGLTLVLLLLLASLPLLADLLELCSTKS